MEKIIFNPIFYGLAADRQEYFFTKDFFLKKKKINLILHSNSNYI